MYSYNISKKADQKAFNRACSLVESIYKDLIKGILIEDVDGTQIQIYALQAGEIKVFNDYEVDAVYIDSDVELGNIMM